MAKRLVPVGAFVVDEMGTVKVPLADALHVRHVLTSINIGGIRRDDLPSIPVRGNWVGWYNPSQHWMPITSVAPPDPSVMSTFSIVVVRPIFPIFNNN